MKINDYSLISIKNWSSPNWPRKLFVVHQLRALAIRQLVTQSLKQTKTLTVSTERWLLFTDNISSRAEETFTL